MGKKGYQRLEKENERRLQVAIRAASGSLEYSWSKDPLEQEARKDVGEFIAKLPDELRPRFDFLGVAQPNFVRRFVDEFKPYLESAKPISVDDIRNEHKGCEIYGSRWYNKQREGFSLRQITFIDPDEALNPSIYNDYIKLF